MDQGDDINGSGKKLPYASMPTRFFSFDQFLGAGRIDESYTQAKVIPCEIHEDLRKKFGSQLQAKDLPSTNGAPLVHIPIYKGI